MQVRIDAELSFRNASPEALMFYKQSCIEGTLDGRRFPTCHFGTLAKGNGQNFEGLTDDEAIRRVCEYAATLNFNLNPFGPRSSIEEFCLSIGRGDTIDTSRDVAYLARWCDVEIHRRERKQARSLAHNTSAGSLATA